MKFDFIAKRYLWLAIALMLVIPGLVSIAVQGFHLGIDFTGGTLMDLKFSRPVTVAEVRTALNEHNLEGSTIQLAVNNNNTDSSTNVFIRTHVLTENERRGALDTLSKTVAPFEIMRIEKVGAVIGGELTRQAFLAVAIASLLMIIYITYRFELKFALAGVIALLQTVVVVMGVVSIIRMEVDASFIAAILTILGYAINDTIVIFDRIRENLKQHRKSDNLAALVNRSIWQTMTRSIYTVLTVLFATVSLYVFGGETTKNFSFTLLIGFSLGAYSSICNATSLWYTFKVMSEKQKLAQKTRNDD